MRRRLVARLKRPLRGWRLAIHLTDLVAMPIQLQSFLASLRQLVWGEAPALDQYQGLAFGIRHGADPHNPHSDRVILELTAATLVEWAHLIRHQNVLVAVERDTGLLTCLEHLCTVQEVDLGRRPLKVVAGP